MSSRTSIVETKEDMMNSVELNMNAKGEYYWSIKIYSDYAGLNNVVRDLEGIDASLRTKFRGSIVKSTDDSVEAGPPIGTALPEAKLPRKPSKVEPQKPSANPKAVKDEHPEEIDFDDFFEEEDDEEEEEAPPPPPRKTRRSRK